MRNRLTIILSMLVMLITAPAWAQSYPVTDTFSGSGALSANWTKTTAYGSTFVPLTQASGTVGPSVSTSQGLESYTGATFTNDQYSQGSL